MAASHAGAKPVTETAERGGTMTQTLTEVASAADREIVATRVFDAPRELGFEMWMDVRPGMADCEVQA